MRKTSLLMAAIGVAGMASMFDAPAPRQLPIKRQSPEEAEARLKAAQEKRDRRNAKRMKGGE